MVKLKEVLSSDAHSQDLISSVFSRLEKEVCLKFFHTPLNFNATTKEKILYISNKEHKKACPPENYDYSGSVVVSFFFFIWLRFYFVFYACIFPKR